MTEYYIGVATGLGVGGVTWLTGTPWALLDGLIALLALVLADLIRRKE